MGVVFCFNLLFMVRIVIRFATFKTIICTTLLTAATCCIAAIYSGEMGLWIGMLPMASAISLGGNTLVASFSNLASEKEQGWVMGISHGLGALSWAVAPPLVGLILAFSFHVPLYIAGILFLAGLSITTLKLKNH
jgi:MFS family permease